MGERQQKGVGIVNARAYVHERFGGEGWSAVIAHLPAADRQQLDTVLPVGWYPQSLFMRLVRAIDEVHGVGDLAMAVQLGRWSADRDLTTVYRLFFRLASPAFVIEKATEYWRRFHEEGEWEIERVGKMHVIGTLRGWSNDDSAYCRVNGAYMGRLLELVGARGVVIDHAQCTSRGDPACVFRARWGDELHERPSGPLPVDREPRERAPADSGKVPTAGAREAFSASVDALASNDKRRPR